MPSVMAIVSKAVFEKEARGLGIGDVWATDRYASNHKGLAAVDGGGDLYLVTVRPPEVFCVVAVLKAPRHGADGYRAKPNTVAIRDISAARTRFTFVGGAPLPTKQGTLGMSLQTPRVLTDDDVALIVGAVPTSAKPASATKPTPAKPAKVAPVNKAAPAKPAIMVASAKPAKASKAEPAKPAKSAAKVSLGGIRRELAAGNAGDALPALLALWRSEPSAELAKQIATVSDAALAEVPDLGGKSADVATVWNRHAKRALPGEIPALLATVADATSANAAKRMKLVAKWPPDPRVDAAIAGWLDAPPYHALMTKPFWTEVFKLARQIRDPAQLARLEAADAKIAKGVAATMAGWLREELAELLEELRPILAEVPASTGAVAELAGATEAVRVDTSDLDALLAAVYADPTNDGPRLVYADALSERGDPRGEFIAVQCRLAETPDDRDLRAREKELLDAHGKKWLGELARVVMADYRFERGFLASCRIEDSKRAAATAIASSPLWSTVHTHDGPLELALHPVMKSLRTITYSGWSEEEDTDDDAYDPSKPAAWHRLLVDGSWPFEHLTYRIGGDRPEKALAALAECKALPSLKTLTMKEEPRDAAPMFTAPVLTRLDRFALEFSPNAPDRWAPMLQPLFARAVTPRLTLRLDNSSQPTLITLTRSMEKKTPAYARAEVEVGPTSKNEVWNLALVNEVVEVLQAIPGLREVRVHKRRWNDPKAHQRLERVLKKLDLETWSIL